MCVYTEEINFKEFWHFMAIDCEYIGIGTITKVRNVSDYTMFPMNPWMEIQAEHQNTQDFRKNIFPEILGILMFP